MSARHLWFASLLLGILIGATGLVKAGPSVPTPPRGPAIVPHPCPQRTVTVTTARALRDTLASDFTGTILIPSSATINFDEVTGLPGTRSYRWLQVKSCVTIKGTRDGLDPGPLVVTNIRPDDESTSGPLLEVVGQFVRIEGLRFRGPLSTDDRRAIPRGVGAIYVSENASNVQIDNNSFSLWSWGIKVTRATGVPMTKEQASLISVTRNYFNRNAIEKEGYGVGVYSGYAHIEGNLFNKNRHAVAASWNIDGGKGYVARYNYVLAGGFTVCPRGFCYWNQHFDAHGQFDGYGGIAGEYFEIAYNTIRGAQKYAPWPFTKTRPAFMLRGRPTIGASFHDNVVVHANGGEAVRLKDAGCGPTPGHCNLTVVANIYGTDTTNELAVGDFDGDGRDDVFLANGTGWWYSSAGLTEWRFLRPSSLRIKDLRFGRFNSDARTDVLYSDGVNWWVSLGGTGQPTVLRNDGTRLTDCVFGDFLNGDGLTDAIWMDGSSWSVSPGGAGPWTTRRATWITAANVRVGDFTGESIDDVFWLENNTWHLWDPARNLVRSDHRMPVRNVDIGSLVVADFDGDGFADLGQIDGNGWRWLRGTTRSWAPLRGPGGQPEFRDIRAALFGRFASNTQRLSAIRYASPRFPEASRYGFVLWSGTQDAFAPWTAAWQEMR